MAKSRGHNGGRPAFVATGIDIWIAIERQKGQLKGSKSAGRRSISAICRWLAGRERECTSAKMAPKTLKNLHSGVEKRRRADPEYRVLTDQMLEQVCEAVRHVAGNSKAIALPGRLRRRQKS